mgnify:CR=1 FL=1
MNNIVAIVGRPNVGKSTLFNRLTQSRKAIVEETSGVTRDRHYGKSDWNGIDFSLIDTGGYITNSEDVFENEIKRQVNLAIEEADAILFVVDVTSGITDLDDSVAHMLRKIDKKTLLVVNKVDNSKLMYDANEFYGLGLGEIFCISSINGSGTGDLLDELVKEFEGKTIEEEPELPVLSIIGRPNVGKSSLANVLLGEDRNIVTPIAGTTRDSVSTYYNKFGHEFLLTDTAGLRKKGKVTDNLEFYSVMRSIRAIENSDVCLMMIDATRGIESQDVNIFQIAANNRKGIVLLVNKWDLVEKDTNTTKEFEARIKEKLAPFNDVPIVFTSALTKQRIQKVLDLAMDVYNRRKQTIPTSKLNEVMLNAIQNYGPPSVKGKYIRIKYVTQLKSPSPIFAFFCNLPQYIKDPYKRYLENRLREEFDFSGIPLQLYFRKK